MPVSALPNARPVPEQEAVDRFDLRSKLERYGPGDRQPERHATVLVVPGPLHVPGNLFVDWARNFKTASAQCPPGIDNQSAIPDASAVGLIVEGDLTVDGAIINTNLNGGPFLLVMGATKARTLYAGGAEMRFEGESTFSDAVIGCYNDGYVRFAADLHAPIVIAEDHAFDFWGAAPPYFDPFNGEGDVADWSFLCPGICPDADRYDPSGIDVEEHLLPLVLQGQRIACMAP